jgi:phosphoribosylglycinamide formyltransferase 1
MKPIRTAVLISGRGSNMMALVEAARSENNPAVITRIIANRPDAKGLDYARANGIATAIIDHKSFPNREAFEAALHADLESHGTELVALAGFMRVLSQAFVAKWPGRIINIHPSLLPAYKGLHTHERALADGTTQHGCTVHYVSAELDAGEPILQAEVPVVAGDTPETLAARVLTQEHRIYPQALERVARTLQAKMST